MRISDEALHALVALSDGDLRRSITLLQSAHRFHGTDDTTLVEADDVRELANVVPTQAVDQLWTAAQGTAFDAVVTAVDVSGFGKVD